MREIVRFESGESSWWEFGDDLLRAHNSQHTRTMQPCIVFMVLSSIFLADSCKALSIFIIGDSIDRYIVKDWCGFIQRKGPHWQREFVDRGFHIMGILPSFICGSNATGDSLAFLHHFGSASHGPYFHGYRNGPDRPYLDSMPRIQRAMELYFAEFGAPDRIFYHSAQWDSKYLIGIHGESRLEVIGSELRNNVTAAFRENVIKRLDQITELSRNLSTKLVDIALRTAIFDPFVNKSLVSIRTGTLVHAMNRIIYEIAVQRNLTYYDLDNEIWSIANWNYSRAKEVLRDQIHPNNPCAVLAGEKILMRRYSKYVTVRGARRVAGEPVLWLGEGRRPAQMTGLSYTVG
jgi:hypothetical protein